MIDIDKLRSARIHCSGKPCDQRESGVCKFFGSRRRITIEKCRWLRIIRLLKMRDVLPFDWGEADMEEIVRRRALKKMGFLK